MKVSLGLSLLRELSSAGPSKVVHWSLYSGLLAYSNISGYTIGSMLAQVMSAVVDDDDDVSCNGASINDISDISRDENDGPVERIIRLTRNQDHFNTTTSITLPPDGCAPVMWGKVLLNKFIHLDAQTLNMRPLLCPVVMSTTKMYYRFGTKQNRQYQKRRQFCWLSIY